MEEAEGERCCVCYEGMELIAFQLEDEPAGCQVVGNCTRLGCGHALHTKCLIDTLQATGGRCPMCNIVRSVVGRNDTYRQRLRFEAECQRVLNEVKREPAIREGLLDLAGFSSELRNKAREFRKRVEAFKDELRTEMGIERLLHDIDVIKRTTVSNFKKSVATKNSLVKAAFHAMDKYSLERYLFNRGSSSQFSLWSAYRLRQTFF